MVSTQRPVGVKLRRVGYIVTHYPKLSQTFVSGEIRELEKLGIAVVPLSLNEPEPTDLSSAEARRDQHKTVYLKAGGIGPIARASAKVWLRHPVALSRFVAESVVGLRWDLRAMAWRMLHIGEAMLARDACIRRGVTHVHAQFGQATATVAWMASEIDRSVCGGDLRWSFTIHGFQDFVNERETRLDLKADSAEFVVCVSDFTRSQLMRVSDPNRWDNFHVVRVGIDLDRFPPRLDRGVTDVPLVVSVGRLSPEKGHVVLLDAIAALRAAGSDVELELVGDGEFRAGIVEHIGRRGLGNAVRLLGELPHDEIADRLAVADVFCLPSFSEGLPVSIMEAMAVGLPVVTTYVSGIPELAVDKETALVVPAGNAGQLSYALATMLADRALRDRLATNAIQRVHRDHDVHRNVAVLADLFERAGRAGAGVSA